MKFKTTIKRSDHRRDQKIYCVEFDSSVSLHEFNKIHDWCMDTFGVLGYWYEDIHGLNFYQEEDFVLFTLRWS
jgi:hypothetical protein